MTRIECSVRHNGKSRWGLKVLGGPSARREHFDQRRTFVILDLDGVEVAVNVDKPGFWSASGGELFSKRLGVYVKRHGLRSGDHVWLRAVEPGAKFAVETQRTSDAP